MAGKSINLAGKSKALVRISNMPLNNHTFGQVYPFVFLRPELLKHLPHGLLHIRTQQMIAIFIIAIAMLLES
jgi:hypothetical protein